MGPHHMGPHHMGPHHMGPHPMGPHPMGPHPMGPHPMVPHPIGPLPMGPRPMRHHLFPPLLTALCCLMWQVGIALFGAFVTRLHDAGSAPVVDLLDPLTFAGLLIGSMLPYW
jgi:hypothetical protein